MILEHYNLLSPIPLNRMGIPTNLTPCSYAAAYVFFLVKNHPFIDGIKRVAHASMEGFLYLNGKAIRAGLEEQEELMLGLAAGKVIHEKLNERLKTHTEDIE